MGAPHKGVICAANQRIPNVCRIARAACCEAIRGHQLGAKDLLHPTSFNVTTKNINISKSCQQINKCRFSSTIAILPGSASPSTLTSDALTDIGISVPNTLIDAE